MTMLYLNSSSFAERQLLVIVSAVLILDEDTLFLQEPQEQRNFRVYGLQKGMMDSRWPLCRSLRTSGGAPVLQA